MRRHYAKPIIANMCSIIMDPCNEKPYDVALQVDKETGEIAISRKSANSNDKENCDCLCEEECVEQDTCCDEQIVPYVAELFVVKDEIGSYEPGEISYIENIMQDEIRVRKHRHLQREEIYSETEEEINTFEEKEHQVDEQFSLHKEIDKVIDKELSLDAGASYQARSGTEKIYQTYSGELNASSSTARKDARKLVQDKSKQVIEKAISRVEKKVRTLSTRKMINETEEKNKHVFGGTTGASSDMSRQFYYVNQLRKAQVYSYGMRQILDFTIPEPGALYERLLEMPFEGNNPGEFKLEKPNCKEVTREGYIKLVDIYGISNVQKPPVQSADTNMAIPISKTVERNGNKTYSIPVIIPSGYVAVEMSIKGCSVTMHRRAPHHRVNIKLGSGMVEISRGDDTDENYETCTSSIHISGAENFTITTLKLKDFNLTINLKLKANPVDLTVWKQDVCTLLNDAYNKKNRRT